MLPNSALGDPLGSQPLLLNYGMLPLQHPNSIVTKNQKMQLYAMMALLLLCSCKDVVTPGQAAQTMLTTVPPDSTSIPYKESLAGIELKRAELSASLKKTPSTFNWELADSFLTDAVLHKITPYWIGTDWDFNGVTEVPGEGSIACGYFVSTVLRDAGFRLQRISLSQQASQQIVKTFGSEVTKKYSNVPLKDFVSQTREQGKGIYIVGLDYHVGLLIDDGTTLWFIHSTYVHPGTVIKEEANSSAVLHASAYRITGKLSGDQRILRNWLTGGLFATRRS